MIAERTAVLMVFFKADRCSLVPNGIELRWLELDRTTADVRSIEKFDDNALNAGGRERFVTTVLYDKVKTVREAPSYFFGLERRRVGV